MTTNSVALYLESGRRSLEKLNKQRTDAVVVMGNESADLDSVISSIVMGFYTAHSFEEGSKDKHERDPFVFSVINCSREDLNLRTESVFYLKENGIKLDQLICRDEIDLNGLHSEGKLKLTLVDHNVLCTADAHLDSSVSRVVDHHKIGRKLFPGDVVEIVGSCCTLLAEIVLPTLSNNPVLCRLLCGPIVLDTVNFSDAAGKTTPKDLKVIKDLETALGGSSEVPDRSELFKSLVFARSDVSQLTTAQLLRKDAKDIRFDQIAISIPSVPVASKTFLDLPRVLETFKAHMAGRRVDAIVILSLCVEELTGEMKREIVVYSDSDDKAKEICGTFENSELKVELKETSTAKNSALYVYKQGNVSLSRKYVVPLLEEHFGKTNIEHGSDSASLAKNWVNENKVNTTSFYKDFYSILQRKMFYFHEKGTNGNSIKSAQNRRL